MFICLCKGVTDAQIRESVEKGATSLKQVCKELDVGTQCCKCIPETREIIQQNLLGNMPQESIEIYVPSESIEPRDHLRT